MVSEYGIVSGIVEKKRILSGRIPPFRLGRNLSGGLVCEAGAQGLWKGISQRAGRERGCGRLEWWCLDWNQPSIDFYLVMGAEVMSDWTVYRITGERLKEMAEEA